MSPVGGQQREADISHDISWPAVDIVCDICVICATFCLMEMAKVVRERVTKVSKGGGRNRENCISENCQLKGAKLKLDVGRLLAVVGCKGEGVSCKMLCNISAICDYAAERNLQSVKVSGMTTGLQPGQLLL